MTRTQQPLAKAGVLCNTSEETLPGKAGNWASARGGAQLGSPQLVGGDLSEKRRETGMCVEKEGSVRHPNRQGLHGSHHSGKRTIGFTWDTMNTPGKTRTTKKPTQTDRE